MEILIGAAALLLFLPNRSAPLYYPPGLVPLLLIAGYIFLQILPLPAGLVRLLSPEAGRIYHHTTAAVDASAWISLSLHPRATLLELARFLSYLVFYVVAVQLLADRRRLMRTLNVITVLAGLLSLFVIVQLVSRYLNYPFFPHEKLFWIRESVNGLQSVGPYVNRNHYAGLMEMIFPLVVVLFLLSRPGTRAASWKERLRDFFSHPRFNHYLLHGTAAILIGTSVFVTLSRGGILSLTLSMGVLSVWLTRRSFTKKTALVTAFIFICILVLTGTDVWNMIFERFSQIRNASGEIQVARLDRWADHLKIIADFFLFGTGLGTMRDIYPLYRTLPGTAVLEYAHNDYLGFMATGGIVLVVLMAAALAGIVRYSYRSYGRRHDRTAIYLFAASLTAVLSILLHSLVDFNLQLGANGLYFFLVLALAVSAAHTRFHDNSRPTLLPRVTERKRLSRTASIAFFLAVLLLHGGILLANYHSFGYRHVSLTTAMPGEDLRQTRKAVSRAAARDPLNADYYHTAANTAVLLAIPAAAEEDYARAVCRNPLKVSLLADAGWFFYRQGRAAAGETLMRAAIDFSWQNVDVYLNYAAVMFEDRRIEQGLAILKEAMTRYPSQADTCLALMAWFNLPDDVMRQALPEQAPAWRAFGNYLKAMGRN
ncbi:MAG: O-antigen ligase family protein, partial [Desulfosudaceae bacterium]